MAEFEAVRVPAPYRMPCSSVVDACAQALREYPASMYADDAAGRAARFADISSRVPGRDKLVRNCPLTDWLHA